MVGAVWVAADIVHHAACGDTINTQRARLEEREQQLGTRILRQRSTWWHA